jgi:hypothetical protein
LLWERSSSAAAKRSPKRTKPVVWLLFLLLLKFYGAVKLAGWLQSVLGQVWERAHAVVDTTGRRFG